MVYDYVMKQALRKQIGAVLSRLDPAEIARQSAGAAGVLRTLPAYRAARTIAFYMHMDTGELQTAAMIANAFEDGKRVFLPHIVRLQPGEAHPWFPSQKTHLRMLELPSLAAVHALEPRGKYRLREPTEGMNALTDGGLDLVVLPGVGFSTTGGRLGHGAGYYDAFVNEHEAVTGRVPQLVGVGLAEQLVAELPVEPHDRTLDAVVLGAKQYK